MSRFRADPTPVVGWAQDFRTGYRRCRPLSLFLSVALFSQLVLLDGEGRFYLPSEVSEVASLLSVSGWPMPSTRSQPDLPSSSSFEEAAGSDAIASVLGDDGPSSSFRRSSRLAIAAQSQQQQGTGDSSQLAAGARGASNTTGIDPPIAINPTPRSSRPSRRLRGSPSVPDTTINEESEGDDLGGFSQMAGYNCDVCHKDTSVCSCPCAIAQGSRPSRPCPSPGVNTTQVPRPGAATTNTARNGNTDRAFKCPVCFFNFGTAALLAKHLRDNSARCVITPSDRPQIIELGLGECRHCSSWHVSGSGMSRHERKCDPERLASSQPPPPDNQSNGANNMDPSNPSLDDEFMGQSPDLLSDSNLDFLYSVPIDELSQCPYSTLVPNKTTEVLYSACQDKVTLLFTSGKDEAAWRLHYFIIRVLFFPSPWTDGPNRPSLNQVVRSRCHSFMRGEWSYLWEEQKKARPMGPPDPDLGSVTTDEDKLHHNQTLRAKKLAKEGEFSKAMSVLDGSPICDLTDPRVHEELLRLHRPPDGYEDADPISELPDAPEDLATSDVYEYKFEPVELPSGREVTVSQYIQPLLRKGVGQGLAGDRYEHPWSLVSVLIGFL